jgi:imidazolonepropionase-like amidohydrolase
MTVAVMGAAAGAVRGGLLLGTDGAFHPNGLREIPDRARDDDDMLDATGLWITPGFVDAHSHLSWSDFDAADRPSDEGERAAGTARNQLATLRAGVTTVRDAGGYDPALHGRLTGAPGPALSLSIDIIGPADARGERHLRDRVAALADEGADWIKVATTGGVGAGTRQQEPVFTRGELTALLDAATRAGLPVMAHAWGGPAIDQALDLGVRSIEHAVFLTAAQAQRAAASRVFVVPTVWIYRDVLELAQSGRLPSSLAAAARRAVEAHPAAIQHCLASGVPLAMGTDAGLASQHGWNLHEVAAMIEAGVPASTALVAATTGGRQLLGEDVAGRSSDLVFFRRDPSEPETLRDPTSVVAVVQAGRVVSASG